MQGIAIGIGAAAAIFAIEMMLLPTTLHAAGTGRGQVGLALEAPALALSDPARGS